jgi:hypothetical protein
MVISAPVMTEPSSRVMMMRMSPSLFSRRSCGSVPLIVIVDALVIGSLGSVRVGRPGSIVVGGGVGDPLLPIEVMNGSAMAARPIAPAITNRVMNAERAVVIVPPTLRDVVFGRWDAEAT